jgi:hypothetical protein
MNQSVTRNEGADIQLEGSTRRDAIRRAGGGLALAGLALGFGKPLLAQEATPEAGEGLEGSYVVIRVRKLKADRSGEELADLVRNEFLPLLRLIPGFVSYTVFWNAETRDWAAIGVFADKAGADESNNEAMTWGFESGATDFTEGDPIVIEGEIAVAS